jgi:hypothetical protein
VFVALDPSGLSIDDRTTSLHQGHRQLPVLRLSDSDLR